MHAFPYQTASVIIDVKIIHLQGWTTEHLRSIGVFVRTVELGSFAAAAAALGLTPSAVSKSISVLERSLNVRLVTRSTSGIAPTDEGARFYDRCRTIVSDLERAEREVSQSRVVPQGLLRLALHVTPARLRILPALPRFTAANPGVRLEVRILAGARASRQRASMSAYSSATLQNRTLSRVGSPTSSLSSARRAAISSCMGCRHGHQIWQGTTA